VCAQADEYTNAFARLYLLLETKIMSTTNKHGVHISLVSSVHTSFGKHSGIPSEGVTPDAVANWKRQRDSALGPLARVFGDMMPLDVTYAGCWLAPRLRTIRKHGKRVYTDEGIERLLQQLGRPAVNDGGRTAWRNAVAVWSQARKRNQ
jgi:hypothetical protein